LLRADTPHTFKSPNLPFFQVLTPLASNIFSFNPAEVTRARELKLAFDAMRNKCDAAMHKLKEAATAARVATNKAATVEKAMVGRVTAFVFFSLYTCSSRHLSHSRRLR
jgi:hypothetical protein